MSDLLYRQKDLYCKDSPVFIQTVLCVRLRKETVRLYVDFQNIAAKMIAEAIFTATGSDTIDGEKQILQLKLKKSHDSAECNAVRHCIFEMTEVYRIDDVLCTKVRFEDGTCWELSEGSVWKQLPQQKHLFTRLGRPLYEQYQRDVMGFSAWFVPDEYDRIRRCACGAINSRHAIYCRRCGTKLEYVFSSMDLEVLRHNYERYKNARDAAEKQELNGIKNRYEYFRLTLNCSTEEDSLQRERERRAMIRDIHYEGEKLGITCYPDRRYSFMRKPEETDEDLLHKGCIPPDETYSFWRLPESKDTYLLDEGYRPPDAYHHRWYWPEERVR